MTHILIFSFGLRGAGGTETVLEEWHKNLTKEQGYYLDILTFGKGSLLDNAFFQDKNVTVLPAGKPAHWLGAALHLHKLLKKQHYDYIFCLSFSQLFITHYVLKTLPRSIRDTIKVFYWAHFMLHPAQFNTRNRRLLGAVDGALSLCSGMSESFEQLGLPARKIHTVYNPVSRAEFKPKSKNGNRFYYIGRLIDEPKRVSDIIKTFNILINQNHQKAYLDIIGIGESLPLYQSLIQEYNLSDYITIHNQWLSDPWSHIPEIDALILSSKAEGFGMVIAEALARGVPVISSNCEVGPKELIIDSNNGYLYDVGDINQLADCIHNIMKGCLKTSPSEISSSIERMYTDNYFSRIQKILSPS